MRRDLMQRALLAGSALVLVIACVLLYPASVDAAQHWPSLAPLRVPIYLGIVIGAIPIATMFVLSWRLVSLAGHRENTDHAAVLLRHIRILAAATAIYFTAGLAGFGLVTDLMHPTLLAVWAIIVAAAIYLISHISRRLRFPEDLLVPMPRTAPAAQQVTSTACQ